MATATKRTQAGQAEVSQPASASTASASTASASTASASAAGRGDYRCDCGHILRVFGLGRHRVYFEPGDARLDNPVMDRVCPECGRGLHRKRGQ